MNAPEIGRTMPDRVLVAYATRAGSTREAADALAAALCAGGLAVQVTPAAEVNSLADHGAVVLGTVRSPRDEDEWRSSRTQMEGELARYAWLRPVSVQMS